MLKVGLTGGIGSGKSTIAAIFETLGIPVSYADDEAKRLMNEDPQLRDAIAREFGAEAYANGVLNRKYLAGQVFNDKVKLEKLNDLVHPVTVAAGAKWMHEQAALGHPYAIREAALIFEARGAGHLDFVIGVYAPETLRIHRTMQRDNTTREAVQQRMKNQIDEEIKMRLCDAVVRNDEQEAVLPQVLALHQKLLTKDAERLRLL